MRHISIARAATSVGMVFAGWHAIWVTLVGLGWAANVLNFILELDFLRIRFELAPYSAFTAFLLIAITFCVGAFLGGTFAILWNWLTLAGEPEWARDTKRPSATMS